MGAVYVAERDDNGTPGDSSDDVWVEDDWILNPDALPLSWFGAAVSLNGDRVLVGAPDLNDYNESGGWAYIFRPDDGGWFWYLEQELVGSDVAPDDEFGKTVSLNGEWAVIGAHRDDDDGINSGSAYVYKLTETSWVERD